MIFKILNNQYGNHTNQSESAGTFSLNPRLVLINPVALPKSHPEYVMDT